MDSNLLKRFAIIFVILCWPTPSRAGELDELMKGIKQPTKQAVTSPQSAPSESGFKDVIKERTDKYSSKWSLDPKQSIKGVLQGLPTSPVMITQLIMSAALPSVGDALSEVMSQAQGAGQFHGETLGALSTMLSGGGQGGGGGGGGSPVEATQLTACLKSGGDAEACIENPSGPLTGQVDLKLSKVLADAGVDGLAWDLLGEATASASGVNLSVPTKNPYSLVNEQRSVAPTATPQPPNPLSYRILLASDGTGNDASEFWTILEELGLPFNVYKMYYKQCGNGKFGNPRCEAVDSLATLVAVGETLKSLGGIEAQLADAEAQTNGWELVHGGSALFPMIKPYLAAARPRIQALRMGLEASTGVSLQNYGGRFEKLKLLAEAREAERVALVRQRLSRR